LLKLVDETLPALAVGDEIRGRVGDVMHEALESGSHIVTKGLTQSDVLGDEHGGGHTERRGEGGVKPVELQVEGEEGIAGQIDQTVVEEDVNRRENAVGDTDWQRRMLGVQ
jgi:hypothetical protein